MNRDRFQLRVAAASLHAGSRTASGLWACAVVVLLLIGIAPRQVAGQFARQPALLSRPASVLLVANLETLSLAAVPGAALSVLPSTVAPPAAHSLSIITTWALPKNLTTLRLTVFRDTDAPDGVVPAPDREEAPGRLAFAPKSTALPSGQTVLLQGSGDSNQETSRTNYLQIAPSTKSMGRRVTAEDTAERTERVTLVVQAL